MNFRLQKKFFSFTLIVASIPIISFFIICICHLLITIVNLEKTNTGNEKVISKLSSEYELLLKKSHFFYSTKFLTYSINKAIKIFFIEMSILPNSYHETSKLFSFQGSSFLKKQFQLEYDSTKKNSLLFSKVGIKNPKTIYSNESYQCKDDLLRLKNFDSNSCQNIGIEKYKLNTYNSIYRDLWYDKIKMDSLANLQNEHDNSFILILNDKEEIIFSTQSNIDSLRNADTTLFYGDKEPCLRKIFKKMREGKSGVVDFYVLGKKYVVAFIPLKISGFSCARVISESDLNLSSNDFLSINVMDNVINRFVLNFIHKIFFFVSFYIVIFLLLSLFFYYISNEITTRSIQSIVYLIKYFEEVASGNLDSKQHVLFEHEFTILLKNFDKLIQELKNQFDKLSYETATKKRIEAGSEMIESIYQNIRNKGLNKHEKYETALLCDDFSRKYSTLYDVFIINERNLVLTVAEVSDNGIPGTLFLLAFKVLLKSFIKFDYFTKGLDEIFTKLNNKIINHNEAMMFITTFVGVLDLQTGELKYVNAGHNPPIYYNSEKDQCEFLDFKKNFVLGLNSNFEFTEQKMTLNKGDLLFFMPLDLIQIIDSLNFINSMNQLNYKVDELQTLIEEINKLFRNLLDSKKYMSDFFIYGLRFK